MLNRKAIQKELDLAAEELDRKGMKELADKVDFYNDRLQRASAREIPLIRRALIRVQEAADRRGNRSEKLHAYRNLRAARAARRRAILTRRDSRREGTVGLHSRRESVSREHASRRLAELRSNRTSSLRRALRARRLNQRDGGVDRQSRLERFRSLRNRRQARRSFR